MIRELTLTAEITGPAGLQPSGTIRDLGPVVILAGAKGAGKSRHLRLVADLLVHAPPAAILVDGPAGLGPPTPRDIAIDLTLRPLTAAKQREDPVHQAHGAAQDTLDQAARALFNAGHAQLAGVPAIAEAGRRAGRLATIVEALLGQRFVPMIDERDGSVRATLGERRLDVNTLPQDERMLLTWAVLLHRHDDRLHDAVLLLDGPERLLGPAALARLFSPAFRTTVLGARGQLWIATRSPTVLLAAHAEKVLLAADDRLQWSDPATPRVLAGLADSGPQILSFAPPTIPVGPSDFRNLRRDNARYVDKTAFIAEVLSNAAQVLLFTRPRRFGKTMNQSALRYFLERSDEDRSDLFADLAVWRNPAARRHFQRYPVIELTFKDVKARTWAECLDRTAKQLSVAFQECREVWTSGALSEEEGDYFAAVLAQRASPSSIIDALRFLSGVLARHHDERVVILLDEYDTPIHSAYLHGYYDEAIDFFRPFLSEAFKDNPHIIKGVLTGVLRVAKESLFSGLNNVVSYSLLHPDFAESFGFTPDEVTELLQEIGEQDRLPLLEAWYNGYRFGGRTIYNPWSIANYLNQRDREPRPFWTDTADPGLIKRLLLDHGIGLRGDLQALLAGGTIHKTIPEDLVLRDIEQRPDSVWSLLLFAGYLKPSSLPDLGSPCALMIPNLEVAHAFESLVRSGTADRLGGADEVLRLARAILAGDEPSFSELLQRFLDNCMSYQSVASQTPELAYEAFLLGLLVTLRPDYDVASQQHAGRGRADILLIPRSPGRPGAVLELKTRTKARSEEADLDAALAQIADKKYTDRLAAAGAAPIHEYAAVFDGQRVWVKQR